MKNIIFKLIKRFLDKVSEYGNLINSSDDPEKLDAYINNNIIIALMVGSLIGVLVFELVFSAL